MSKYTLTGSGGNTSSVKELLRVKFDNDWSISLMRVDGTDRDLSQIARTSRGVDDEDRTAEQDLRLITRLLRDDHGSPIEFCSLTMLVVCPLYVRSQWMRHRMASYSEKSGRYSEVPNDDIQDEAIHNFRLQGSAKNRQESGEHMEDEELQKLLNMKVQKFNNDAKFLYNYLIEAGVAREQARMVLPVMTLTKFYCQMNLRSLMNFIALRCAEDAQSEIRLFAEAILNEFVQYAFPSFYLAWKEAAEIDKI